MAKLLVLKPTGETAELITDAIQSDGAAVEFITSLPAGAAGPPLHIHARQSERFEPIEGPLVLHAGGEEVKLGVGDVFVVPPGTPHRFENPGPGTARWKVRVEPALNFDYLAEAMISLVNAAHPRFPRPEDMAFVLTEAAGEYYLADSPPDAQDRRNRELATGAIPDVPGGPMSLTAYRDRQRSAGRQEEN